MSSLASSRLQEAQNGVLMSRFRSHGPVASGATFFSFFGAPTLSAASALLKVSTGDWRNFTRQGLEQKPTVTLVPSCTYWAVNPGRASPPHTTQRRAKTEVSCAKRPADAVRTAATRRLRKVIMLPP